MRSQNGWPAFATPDEGRFVRFTAGGRGWWAANSDVAVVLTEFVNRFDREVEKVVMPGEQYDDWSFANRLVRGSTATVSNHGSATAIDVNATRHLLGREGTFLPGDEAALERIVDAISDDDGRPVLRWGGSYSGRKDEMHIEINASAARVRQAADKIRNRGDDVSFQDKHKLTAADVAAYGSPNLKVGQEKSYDELVRFSPAVARLRREQAAGFAALTATIGLLAGPRGATLSEAQISAAAEAGARAALAQLGDALDPDGPA